MYHAAALALVAGAPGVEHFTDAWASHPDVVAVRDRIEIHGDTSLSRDQAVVSIRFADGSMIEEKVVARGTRHRRMDRSAVADKFLANVSPVLGSPAAHGLIATVLDAPDLPNVESILRQCESEECANAAPIER